MSVLLPLLLAIWVSAVSLRRRGPTGARPAHRPREGLVPILVVAALAQFLAPGPIGAVVAIVFAVVLLRRERARPADPQVLAWTPVAADLLAACLSSGVDPRAAMAAMTTVAPASVQHQLASVTGALSLGADQRTAWASIREDPAWRGIAGAFIRSADTGAPLAQLLTDWSTQRRLDALSEARAAVRAAGVRIVLPVGLCFLPAFVLVGVVPIIAGLISNLVR